MNEIFQRCLQSNFQPLVSFLILAHREFLTSYTYTASEQNHTLRLGFPTKMS